jgi:hypothetical protein
LRRGAKNGINQSQMGHQKESREYDIFHAVRLIGGGVEK